MSNVVPLNPPRQAPPPIDIETEQALLGALLVNNDVFDLICEIVEARHFSEPLHQRIYDAAAALIRKGQIASPVSLRGHFALDQAMTQVGGTGYLAELCAFTPSVRDAANFAGMVRDLFLRRELMRIAEEIRLTAGDPPIDMNFRAQVEAAEQMLHGLTTITGSQDAGPLSAETLADQAIAEAELAYQNPEAVGASTGMPSLDEVLGRLVPEDLIVLGGATSSGKTALAQQIGWYLATTTRRVAAWSIEMGGKQYLKRHIAQIAGVSASRIESGKVSADEIQRVVAAREAFRGVGLAVDGTPGVSVANIRTRARKLARVKPLDLIIVDHLRFVQPADPRALERDQIQQITRDFKALARELNCCVLLISHMNRDYKGRESKRPVMSDLYGGSAIEQNADAVLFVHREHYWLARSRPGADADPDDFTEWTQRMQATQGKAELIVAKRRRGPIGECNVAFHDDMTLFTELDAPPSVRPGRLV